MRDFVCTSLFLLAVALFDSALGPRIPRLCTWLGFFALVPVVVVLGRGARRRPALVLPLALVSLVLAVSAEAPVRFLLLALVFALLQAACDARDPRTGIARTLALASLGWAVFAGLRDHVPLWQQAVDLSRAMSQAAGSVVGVEASYGPTYSGAWILAAIAILFAARVAATGRLRLGHAIGGAALCAAAAWSWLALARFVPGHTHGSHAASILGFRIVQFVLCLGGFAVFLRGHGAGGAQAARGGLRAWTGAGLVLVGGALLFWCTPVPTRPVRVLVDGRGGFGMEPLVWGRYGPDAPRGASLATLPAVLRAYGFGCALHDTTLDAAALRACDVLVVMNPRRDYAPQEHASIWEFVRRGGGLLVLGDHTNIQETMGPLNRLLAPCGVRVEFDSAIPLVERWSWYGCMRVHPHPVTHGLRDESEIKVSVGASLHLPAGALPLFTGRDAFSDPGDWENKGGAYLGNMRHDRGEPLGDLPLAGERRVGRGRVIVFGDTSPFQRSAVAFTHALVARVVTRLASERGGPAPGAVRAAGAVTLVCGAILLALGGGPNLVGWTAAALAILLAALQGLSTVRLPPGPRQGDVAWIDLAHGNRVDVHAGRDDGIGGLVDHLWRQGYVPLGQRRFDAATLEAARVFVTVAPAFEFSPDERRSVRRFVERGGLAIVAAGYEEHRGVEALLGEFGYSIGRVPIGAAHRSVTHLEGQRVLMHESWPVLRPEGRGEVWVEAWGHPLVVHERIGRGGLLVIGDSKFLCDVKLESEQQFVEANIDFLRAAIQTAQPSPGGGAP